MDINSYPEGKRAIPTDVSGSFQITILLHPLLELHKIYYMGGTIHRNTNRAKG